MRPKGSHANHADIRRTITFGISHSSLASIGDALEFCDFVIFVFFVDVIGKVFFAASLPDWVRQAQTLRIFGAGYLAVL